MSAKRKKIACAGCGGTSDGRHIDRALLAGMVFDGETYRRPPPAGPFATNDGAAK
jgi:hypothetical protein